MSELYLLALQAKDPNTSPSRLHQITRETKDPEILSLVAQNPSTERYTLLQLLGDFPAEVTNNTAFSLLLLETPNLLSTADERTQYQLASHPNTPASLLGILLVQGKKEVQFLLSLRADLSEDFLLEMVSRGIEAERALEHPNATERVWQRAAATATTLRQWMAQSPQLPPLARQALAECKDPHVQLALQWRDEPPKIGRSPKLRHVGATNVGAVREHNEDDFVLYQGETLSLFGVFDGMGGASTGIIAAEASHRAFEEEAKRADVGPLRPMELFYRAIRRAYDDTVEKSYGYGEYLKFSNGKKISSLGNAAAASSLLLQGDNAYLANIGDCRIYLLRDQTLTQLTEDHSLINEFKRAGQPLDAEQAERLKNVITRCIGHSLGITADLSHLKTRPNDLFLLCSDGVHGMINDPKIASVLQEEAPLDQKLTRIIDESLNAGGKDNLTAILVEIVE